MIILRAEGRNMKVNLLLNMLPQIEAKTNQNSRH